MAGKGIYLVATNQGVGDSNSSGRTSKNKGLQRISCRPLFFVSSHGYTHGYTRKLLGD